MKIYTRTGDRGETGLFGGKRIRKDSPRISAIGSIDELNSAIGLAIAQVSTNRLVPLVRELTKIQGDLFEIGAVLATPGRIRKREKKVHEKFTNHLAKRVGAFEKLIDHLTLKLLPMKSFILPGGSIQGASLHLARSISRRAERAVVAFAKKDQVADEIITYMNRLSDLLFTMARFVNRQRSVSETPWKGLR
jgi:cob(I)alamin adenosyltransferase